MRWVFQDPLHHRRYGHGWRTYHDWPEVETILNLVTGEKDELESISSAENIIFNLEIMANKDYICGNSKVFYILPTDYCEKEF